jgi:hypothetical protein
MWENTDITFDHLEKACALIKNQNGNNDWFDAIEIQPEWLDPNGFPFDSFDFGVTVSVGALEFKSCVDYDHNPFDIITEYADKNNLIWGCQDTSDFRLGVLLFYKQDRRLRKIYPHLLCFIETFWGCCDSDSD